MSFEPDSTTDAQDDTGPRTPPAYVHDEDADVDFDSEAERASYAYDYPSQAREADLGRRL